MLLYYSVKVKRAFFINTSLFILFLLFISPVFPQQEKKENLSSCSPEGCSPPKTIAISSEYDTPAFYEALKDTQKMLKERFFNIRMIFYKAIREGNPSLCSQAGDYKDSCRQFVKIALFAKMAMEGNCYEFDDSDIQEICLGIKEKDCSGLSDWKKGACESHLSEDIEREKKIWVDHFKTKLNLTGVGIAIERMIALRFGFKQGLKACQKYAPQYLPDKFLCEIIFGDEDVEEILDRIALDLAYFFWAKQRDNPEICEKIKDEDIRKNCLDSKIKVIQDFWR